MKLATSPKLSKGNGHCQHTGDKMGIIWVPWCSDFIWEISKGMVEIDLATRP